MAFVGSGALMGAAMGAAGNWIQGRDMLSGAIEGGTTGAMGAAFMHEVLRNSPNSNNNNSRASRTRHADDDDDDTPFMVSSRTTGTPGDQDGIASARSSAAMGMAGYPSAGDNSSYRGGSARPRPSYRVVRRNEGGNDITIVTGGAGTTEFYGSSRIHNDPMLQFMMHHQAMTGNMGGGGRGRGIEGMNYEQLLSAFGDGTENMGAEEGQIRRLPTHTIKDPEKDLPEEARQCLICLEEFAKGDQRMVLPCLHGFHSECSKKWLRTNASCPVCKHRMKDNGN